MTTLRMVPLGDQAILVSFPDEAAALRFTAQVRQARWPWLVDVVQAYSSTAVYFDGCRGDYATVAAQLDAVAAPAGGPETLGPLHIIPCCYEMTLDLERVARHTKCDVETVIRLHAAATYTVCAIGFCPGFPYLGYLPDELSGVPRLDAPRLRVEAGSVGLTGRQTGIYTEPRPGGWNIVGRTPLELVNVADGYFPLRTGDRVRFKRIGARTFEVMRGRRLPSEPEA
jgi:inhibitor of KinA